MNKSNINASLMKSFLEQFSETHFVTFQGTYEDDQLGIYWLYKVIHDVNNAINQKSTSWLNTKEPTWAIIQSMLHRVFELCEGGFITFITGAWSATELSTRAVMEASINVMYITARDRERRLLQYFSHHWESERKLNQKRLEMSEKLEPEEGKAHKRAALQNINDIDGREGFVNQLLKNEGFISLKEPGWPPNIGDRFKDLGLEADYRTIYSFLSAEVHNDASSLVDLMIYLTIGTKLIPDIATREIYLRVRMYAYDGLRYFIRSAISYANSFDLNLEKELTQANDAINQKVIEMAREIIELQTQAAYKMKKKGDYSKLRLTRSWQTPNNR